MTKNNILKVATEQFAKLGYDGLSMNNLASLLEINKATIYYHFKDKKSLYQEVFISIITHKQDKIEKLVKDPDLSGKEKLTQYIKIIVEKINENPQIVPLTLRELASLGSNVNHTLQEYINKDFEYFEIILNSIELNSKYAGVDYFAIRSFIIGSVCTYHSMVSNISDITLIGLKNFEDKSSSIEYIGDFITQIILDSICNDNKE